MPTPTNKIAKRGQHRPAKKTLVSEPESPRAWSVSEKNSVTNQFDQLYQMLSPGWAWKITR